MKDRIGQLPGPVVVASVCMFLLGCAAQSESAGAASVSGLLHYRERMILPPNAEIRVQLVDLSREDPLESVVGEQTIQEAPPGRIPFDVPYQDWQIVTDHTYAIQATVHVDGLLWYRNEQPVQVITGNNPADGLEILITLVEGR